MTPSSVACVCAVIEVIRVRPPAGAQLIAAHEIGARARPHARSSTPYSKYPSPAAVASDESEQRPARNAGRDARCSFDKQASSPAGAHAWSGRGPSAKSCGRLTLASTGRSRREVSVHPDDCGSSPTNVLGSIGGTTASRRTRHVPAAERAVLIGGTHRASRAPTRERSRDAGYTGERSDEPFALRCAHDRTITQPTSRVCAGEIGAHGPLQPEETA